MATADKFVPMPNNGVWKMRRKPVWLQLLQYLWVGPITLLALPLVLVAWITGGGARLHTGVIEIWGGWVGRSLQRGIPLFGAVNAITCGHLVAGVSERHLRQSRAHERVHVAQFERWGPLFPLVYLWAGWRAQRRGGDYYWDNPYEVEARTQAAAVQDAASHHA